MNEVFADTSGWAAFFEGREPAHDEADRLIRSWQAQGFRVVTSNYVIAELVALLESPMHVPRPRQVQTVEAIRLASWVEIVHIDRQLDEEAWQLRRNRLDKSWSLVDCSSFVLMRSGITEALTMDHHFEQAGFLRLLR